MMKLSTLMMSSVLAFGTSALAQDGPANDPGPNESSSSVANPVARPGAAGEDPYAAVPASPAASANPAPQVAIPADPRDPNEVNPGDAVDTRTRIEVAPDRASDAARGVVPSTPIDPDTGQPNGLYSGA